MLIFNLTIHHLWVRVLGMQGTNTMFRHRVDLVRDWLRNYESEAEQTALDNLWSHWLDTPDARGETFVAPTNEALHVSCSMPPLGRCTVSVTGQHRGWY